MISNNVQLSRHADAKYRIQRTRDMIASARLLQASTNQPNTALLSHEERVAVWTAQLIKSKLT